VGGGVAAIWGGLVCILLTLGGGCNAIQVIRSYASLGENCDITNVE